MTVQELSITKGGVDAQFSNSPSSSFRALVLRTADALWKTKELSR